MENTKYMYDMITQKLEVKLTEHFQENETDANKQEEAQNLLKKHFAECRKQIDSYNSRIHFYDRVETMKKAMESFENKEGEKENNIPKRNIRFFDDVDSSVNSLCIDNKRDFANKLSEIDAEYQKILTRLMDELSTKKGDIKQQI